MATNTQTIPISIRASARELDLIDRAARARGKTRTSYMMDASFKEAREDLYDQPVLSVDEQTYQAFLAALDAPVAENPRLRELLATPAPWQE